MTRIGDRGNTGDVSHFKLSLGEQEAIGSHSEVEKVLDLGHAMADLHDAIESANSQSDNTTQPWLTGSGSGGAPSVREAKAQRRQLQSQRKKLTKQKESLQGQMDNIGGDSRSLQSMSAKLDGDIAQLERRQKRAELMETKAKLIKAKGGWENDASKIQKRLEQGHEAIRKARRRGAPEGDIRDLQRMQNADQADLDAIQESIQVLEDRIAEVDNVIKAVGSRIAVITPGHKSDTSDRVGSAVRASSTVFVAVSAQQADIDDGEDSPAVSDDTLTDPSIGVVDSDDDSAEELPGMADMKPLPVVITDKDGVEVSKDLEAKMLRRLEAAFEENAQTSGTHAVNVAGDLALVSNADFHEVVRAHADLGEDAVKDLETFAALVEKAAVYEREMAISFLEQQQSADLSTRKGLATASNANNARFESPEFGSYLDVVGEIVVLSDRISEILSTKGEKGPIGLRFVTTHPSIVKDIQVDTTEMKKEHELKMGLVSAEHYQIGAHIRHVQRLPRYEILSSEALKYLPKDSKEHERTSATIARIKVKTTAINQARAEAADARAQTKIDKANQKILEMRTRAESEDIDAEESERLLSEADAMERDLRSTESSALGLEFLAVQKQLVAKTKELSALTEGTDEHNVASQELATLHSQRGQIQRAQRQLDIKVLQYDLPRARTEAESRQERALTAKKAEIVRMEKKLAKFQKEEAVAELEVDISALEGKIRRSPRSARLQPQRTRRLKKMKTELSTLKADLPA